MHRRKKTDGAKPGRVSGVAGKPLRRKSTNKARKAAIEIGEIVRMRAEA